MEAKDLLTKARDEFPDIGCSEDVEQCESSPGLVVAALSREEGDILDIDTCYEQCRYDRPDKRNPSNQTTTN